MFHDKHTLEEKHSGRLIRWLLGGVICLFLLAMCAAGSAWWWYRQQLKAPQSGEATGVLVDIVPGTSNKAIADDLQSKGLIRNSLAFQWYTRLNDVRSKLQAGRYELRASESVEAIVARLVNGDVSKDYVTILPAQRLDQLQKTFQKAGFSEQAIVAAFEPAQYAGHPALVAKPADASLEGYLYPDTYAVSGASSVTDVLRASLDEMASALTAPRLAAFAAQGLNPHQAVILASIVEQEVADSQERRTVAQVFLRRLSEGMQLGSDVTYFYAAALSGEEPTPALDSPYNTRKYSGLPPGPISNVSVSSLDAVANPTDTNYLYFVAGDDGKTYFSFTYEEHESLVRQHCTILCQ